MMDRPKYTTCEACGHNALYTADAIWMDDGSSFCPSCIPPTIQSLRTQLAEAEAREAKALVTAERLARATCARLFPEQAEQFRTEEDVQGVIYQIDNMTCTAILPSEAEARVEKARNEGLEEAANIATRRQGMWVGLAHEEPRSEANRLLAKAEAGEAIADQIRSLITNTLESKEG